MKPPPPRLHVIPAIGSAKALVLRRGPTKDVASLLWNRDTGELELGQWLRGRIYEHRCDLSPDGRHMVIFARRSTADLAWTAVSRAPWLTALAFYPQTSTWLGGGAFDAEGRLWFNGGDAQQEKLPDGLRAARPDAYPHGTDGFHMGDTYAAMQVARGWTHAAGTRYDSVLTRPMPDGRVLELRFVLMNENRGIVSNRYAILDGAHRLDMADWEWADVYGGSLHVAKDGQLVEIDLNNVTHATVLHDLTDLRFEPRVAPYSGVDEAQ